MVNARPALIELDHLHKYYGGENGAPRIEVLRGIDLKIYAGEFVAIVGASGSGKSTLMNILGCLDHCSAGCYRFNGEDVQTLNNDTLAWLRREAFGFVFQGYHLIATESARENVEMPAIYAGLPEHERRQRATELLIRLGLGNKLDSRPTQLSGGQQQRISIARALMNGGKIILADEPTGALDKKSGTEVMALLHELAEAGHTIILITHDRHVAEQAQRVIEISDGLIVSDSGPGTISVTAQNINPLNHSVEQSSRLGYPKEAVRASLRMLWSNRFRTCLTLLGIIIGIASVIVMLAVGEGAKQQVVKQMGEMGANIIYMSSQSPPEGGPRGTITDGDLEAIAALPSIKQLIPIIGDPITVRYSNIDRNVYVFSSTHNMPSIHHWKLDHGRFYTDAEDKSRTAVAVLGHQARLNFFPDGSNPLGRQILIGGAPFEVIGVMAERGKSSSAEDYDSMIFIPYLTGRVRVYIKQTQPDYLVVEAISSDKVFEAENDIRKLFKERHNRNDVSIGNAAAQLQAEAETRSTMTMMLSLIAAVSLVVGGIGVMNVMLMTVRERNREIGIRIATGARQADILRQFLIEATLITMVGGAAGVLIGLTIGFILLFLSVPIVFSASAILTAFICTVLTGLVFGYMPAKTAARLDPVIALAGE